MNCSTYFDMYSIKVYVTQYNVIWLTMYQTGLSSLGPLTIFDVSWMAQEKEKLREEGELSFNCGKTTKVAFNGAFINGDWLRKCH